MTEIKTTARSLRAIRFQAALPRTIVTLGVIVLAAAGIRTIVAGPANTVVTRTSATVAIDQGAESFAETFARIYLTWNGQDLTQRQAALAPYLASTLDAAAGVQPGGTSTQSVDWTSVVGEQNGAGQTLVTVAAQTSGGVDYLSVPVARDSHGFLYVAGYPALVGPPASDPNASPPQLEEITDPSLQTVTSRAVTNYLAGNQRDLLADLTPTALVSLPPEHLTVTDVNQAQWVVPGRRVAIQVVASDAQGDSLTLTYELTVEKLDRWYVQSIQANPTFDGGM
jgi:hypothetical protein